MSPSKQTTAILALALCLGLSSAVNLHQHKVAHGVSSTIQAAHSDAAQTEEEVLSAFSTADKNHDGQLSLAETLTLVKDMRFRGTSTAGVKGTNCVCANGTPVADGTTCPSDGASACSACTGDFFLSGTDCTAWKTCSDTEYESTTPSNTADRACTTCADACTAIQFEATACSGTANRVCTDCATGSSDAAPARKATSAVTAQNCGDTAKCMNYVYVSSDTTCTIKAACSTFTLSNCPSCTAPALAALIGGGSCAGTSCNNDDKAACCECKSA